MYGYRSVNALYGINQSVRAYTPEENVEQKKPEQYGGFSHVLLEERQKGFELRSTSPAQELIYDGFSWDYETADIAHSLKCERMIVGGTASARVSSDDDMKVIFLHKVNSG